MRGDFPLAAWCCTSQGGPTVIRRGFSRPGTISTEGVPDQDIRAVAPKRDASTGATADGPQVTIVGGAV